jgi:hypothetical protein
VAALPADIASADIYDVVLDSTGNLWVRSSTGGWAYVIEGGLTDADARTTLPDLYGPYIGLDVDSTAVVLRGLGAR